LLTPSNRKAEAVLKQGIEYTLSQIRQLVGTVEPNDVGGYSIVRKRGETVKFVVQHLDSPEDNFPSFADVAAGHYTSAVLGDIKVLSNTWMMFGRTPEAHIFNSPPMASFKANFIPGGLILNIFGHHFTNGILGFAAFVTQLSENCYAVAHKTEHPSFDLRNLDRTPYGALGFDRRSSSSSSSSASKIGSPKDLPPAAPPVVRNPKEKPVQSLIFHLPKSKALELKKFASPDDGSWISTYNAVCALMWRVFCRIREPVYKPAKDFKPLFGTGVSVTKHFKDAGIPDKLQLNMQFDITTATSTLPQFTLAEVISEAPLSKLAVYMQQLSNGVTREMLMETLQKLENVPIADLSISVPNFPVMALYITDWRVTTFSELDFGFGECMAHRHLFGDVQKGQVVAYPPHKGPLGEDEGMELQLTFEAELVQQLLEDPDWSRYFEFRGVDIWDEESLKGPRSKL
jgi:hypothetical protein